MNVKANYFMNHMSTSQKMKMKLSFKTKNPYQKKDWELKIHMKKYNTSYQKINVKSKILKRIK